MHSFHRSRGRILFEVFCALGVSASCAGAWMQTDASALLAAAAVAALYGLVHVFDLRGPKAALAAGASDAAAMEDQGDLLEYLDTVELPPVVDDEPEAAEPVEEPESAEPVDEPEPAEVVEQSEPAEPAQPDEADRSPIAPLFEPEPLVRTKRAVFGRKAG